MGFNLLGLRYPCQSVCKLEHTVAILHGCQNACVTVTYHNWYICKLSCYMSPHWAINNTLYGPVKSFTGNIIVVSYTEIQSDEVIASLKMQGVFCLSVLMTDTSFKNGLTFWLIGLCTFFLFISLYNRENKCVYLTTIWPDVMQWCGIWWNRLA